MVDPAIGTSLYPQPLSEALLHTPLRPRFDEVSGWLPPTSLVPLSADMNVLPLSVHPDSVFDDFDAFSSYVNQPSEAYQPQTPPPVQNVTSVHNIFGWPQTLEGSAVEEWNELALASDFGESLQNQLVSSNPSIVSFVTGKKRFAGMEESDVQNPRKVAKIAHSQTPISWLNEVNMSNLRYPTGWLSAPNNRRDSAVLPPGYSSIYEPFLPEEELPHHLEFQPPVHRSTVHSAPNLLAPMWFPQPDRPAVACPQPAVSAIALPQPVAPAVPIYSPPTAAQLLRGKKGPNDRKTMLPWGMKRIKTLMALEYAATRAGVPIPFLPDAVVSAYFQTHKPKFIHQIRSFAAPPNVDVRILGKIRITAEEILTFLPNHLRVHDCIYRLAQNGWSPSDMANYINWARQCEGQDAMRYNTVLKMLQNADAAILGNARQGTKIRPRFKTVGFTAERWEMPAHHVIPCERELVDYFLVDLADGVVNWPQGDGARILTHAIWFAVDNDFREVKLSQIHDFIREYGLGLPLLLKMASMGLKDGFVNPDQDAKFANLAKIQNDRDRVRLSIKGASHDK
ncbi:hypothetical protein BCR34DRAFT_603326 [Clohesyomyces aquaticus]|uniref:Uncharacterized protein n=1 Tax=Clohesyomyces aquaticus TaxID=1231657 RepID=A0A1Y1ZG36_9PLEO|nr:hypothetical protein BCR34DRAFT_603326 [Clohesyomyces aquaticus]